MGLIDNISRNSREILRKAVSDVGGFSLNDQGADYLHNGYYGIYGAAYGSYVGSLGQYITDQRALGSTAVFGGVKIISEDVGSAPLFVFEKQDKGKREVPENSLYPILHDGPNPDMSAMEFREGLTAHAILTGNGYAKIERRSGNIVALWPMMPYDVIVQKDMRGRPTYIWKQGNLPQQTLQPKEVLHLKGFGITGTEGLSILQYARQAIGLAIAQEEYAARFFSQDQTPNLVLKHPGKLGPEGVRGVKQAWQGTDDRDGKGVKDNWHTPKVLQEGMDIAQLHPDAQKSQLNEQRIFQLLEVCRVLRLPPHKLAELGRATWGNIGDQNTQYYTETLRPWFVRWEQAIKRCCLADQPRIYAEHSIEGFLRGDFEQQTTGFATLLANGVYSINEVRALLGFNPVDGGNEHFIQLNMQDVVNAATGVATQQPRGTVPPVQVKPTPAPAKQKQYVNGEARTH